MLTKFKNIIAIIQILLLMLTMLPIGTFALQDDSQEETMDLKLTYNTYPSDDELDLYTTWRDTSLPMGNGGIGGSVFGGVTRERIQLNEKSLWSGGPSESRPDYNGGNIVDAGEYGAALQQVQKLFKEGKIDEAIELCNQKLIGTSDGYGFYLSYGNMYLDFDYGVEQPVCENYVRTLDLRTGIVTVEYDIGDTHYVRESYVSYPDNVIVTHLTSSGSSHLKFDVGVEPDNEYGEDTEKGRVTTDYTRTWDTTVSDGLISINGSLDDNQLKFASHTKVIANGDVTDNTSTVSVAESTEATIITTIGTDYKNVYPEYRTGESDDEVSQRVLSYVNNASAKAYSELKTDHVKDYSDIFSRVDLELANEVPDKTTDALLDAYNDGTATASERRYFETLIFQFGRYLTIEGSRETPEDDPSRATLPTNLQGMWVGANNSPWHSDYHLNVNLQANYWPTYVTNMVECAEPLIDYIDSLREPGRVTASIYYGITSDDENTENGFVAHTQNTPYGWTCPGYSFSWGWSTSAVAWILQNCWEHYEYTGDKEYLKTNIYPMMKEAAVFFDQYLVEDSEGYLVSSPAYSPEHGPYTAGNTYEHSLIWQLYEDTITAAEILGVDASLVATWKSNQSRIKGPVEIGDSGQIKEWYEETTIGSVSDFGAGHRHLSNLLGLYPGDYITTETPELLEAAEVSLVERGYDEASFTAESGVTAVGWAIIQRAASWARLGDGDMALGLIAYAAKLIYPNLFQSRPFQIDASFIYTAAVAEMLIQSNAGYINLLPAISQDWASGSVSGLVARGNFEVGMDWSDGKLNTASILSVNGGTATVQYDNIALAVITDSKGNRVDITGVSLDRVSFETVAGETYTVSEIPADEKAPENLTAERISDSEIALNWTAFEGENISYNVYRQVGVGKTQKIAENITTASYCDTNASSLLENVKYQVSAVINSDETKLSDEAEVILYHGIGMVDDSDSEVIYTAGTNGVNFNKENYPEGHQYYQPELYNTTCHNLNGANSAGQTVELTFVGTGIEVIVAKYSNRGYMNAAIDGKDVGKCDTYSSASSVVYGESALTVDDLEYGKHTLVLTVPEDNTKTIQIDAFRILDNTKTSVQSISISSVSGATNITKAGGTLQLEAEVNPADAYNKSVVWSTSDGDILTVDQNGLVTAKAKNGTATVTATSNADGTVKASMDITVPIFELDETVIDESIEMPSAVATAMNTTETIGKNEAITWSSSGWGNPYSGEPTKHYGTRKTSGSAGATFEYTFTGTGIQVICQKTKLQGAFEITLDGMDMGTYSLYTSEADGIAQSVIYENLNLDFGVHTIIGTAVEQEGRTQVNLDAIKTFMPKNQISDEYTDYFTNEYVDSSTGSTFNSDITFSGSSWFIYQEDGHYGGGKCESRAAGEYVEYTFEGSGIRVLANTQIYQAAYQVYIDGVDCGIASMYTTDNIKQNIIYENKNLGQGTHTIKLVTVSEDGRSEWNLDAFEVLTNAARPAYEYFEESITNSDGYSGTANPKITFSGFGSNVGYWKEPFKHHGGRKRDVSTVDAYAEFTFVGTGIQLGAQTNAKYGGYQIYIDGVDYGQYSLKSDVCKNQQPIFSKFDLEYGEHTIKAVFTNMNGYSTGNLDYFCVYNYNSNPEVIDKSALYDTIVSTKGFVQEYYDADKWTSFETSLADAIAVSENAFASQDEIDSAKQALDNAISLLGEPTVTAPSAEGLNASVIHLEGKRAIIAWDEAERAQSYIVKWGENEKTVSAQKLDTMSTLLPNTEYTVEIYPVAEYMGKQAVSTTPITVTFTTLDTVAPDAVTNLNVDVSNGAAAASWNASATAAEYKVYFNGSVITTTETTAQLGNVEAGKTYSVVVTALDENSNESAPVIKNFNSVTIAITGASLTLQNDITVNFKADKAQLDESCTNPYIVAELNGNKTTITEYTEKNGAYYFAFCDIAPYLMNDTITATLYGECDGTTVASKTIEYSVGKYCYNILSKPAYASNTELAKLLVDTLNYGAAAQVYANHNTDALVNSALTAEQKALGSTEAPELEDHFNAEYETVENASAAWQGASLSLQESIEVKLYFSASEAKDLKVKVKTNLGTFVITELESDQNGYCAVFDGFDASQLSEKMYVTVYDGESAISNTLQYSVETYAKNKQTDADAKLVELVNAMMNYGKSAYAYVN